MKTLKWIVLPLVLIIAGFMTYSHTTRIKVVFVRNGDVLEKYIGLKEANVIYEEKIATKQEQLNTIINEYETKVAAFEETKNILNKKEKEEKKQVLIDENQRIKNFEGVIKKELDDEHEQLLTGVLNQVNAFAELYAKENGYDMIIGTTNSGNLMYGKQELDITEEFIESLNIYYKKGR